MTLEQWDIYLEGMAIAVTAIVATWTTYQIFLSIKNKRSQPYEL